MNHDSPQTSVSPDSVNVLPSKYIPGPWTQHDLCICEGGEGSRGKILFVLRHPWGTSDVLDEDELLECARLTAEAPNLLAKLRTAVRHIEHMAAWIDKQGAAYSFESISEDMPGIRAAISRATGADQ